MNDSHTGEARLDEEGRANNPEAAITSALAVLNPLTPVSLTLTSSSPRDAPSALPVASSPPSIGAAAWHATWYSVSAVASWVVQGVTGLRNLFVVPEYDKNNVAEAISKLQTTLAFLDAKMETMNTSIDRYTAEARRLYSKRNRSGAIHQLRLKKMYEREVAKMDSLKFNLESNILHMESVGVMMETVSTIKDTSHQFQVVSKHVDFTKLEDTIEEMFEQRDTSRDIESILQGMHDSHEFDEDELLKELEQLEHTESPDDTPGPDRAAGELVQEEVSVPSANSATYNKRGQPAESASTNTHTPATAATESPTNTVAETGEPSLVFPDAPSSTPRPGSAPKSSDKMPLTC